MVCQAHRVLGVNAAPARPTRPASGPRRRRSLPETLGLSVGFGPAGAVYADRRLGVPMVAATWLAVTQSADPYPGFTDALMLPINIAVGLHLAARHNERADEAQVQGAARAPSGPPRRNPEGGTKTNVQLPHPPGAHKIGPVTFAPVGGGR